MKIQDYNQIKDAVKTYLDKYGCTLQDVFTDDELTDLFADAYKYNDAAVEVTTRLLDKPTIIFTTYRCSIIFEGHSSYYKQVHPLCTYNDLGEDIESIIICAETAYVRYQIVAE